MSDRAGPQPVAVRYKGRSGFDNLNTKVDLRAAGPVGRTLALIRDGGVALFISVNGYGGPEPVQGSCSRCWAGSAA
ncbi:MAG: hypothetical protein WCO00_09760 [Rhodospirillaceae bacterium]